VYISAPVAERSEESVCSRSLAGIGGSDPDMSMDVFSCECCVLSSRGLCEG
jgi:hypothetical protein